MQIIQTTVYRTLGKDYLNESEALEAEKKYISEHCNFNIGDVVYVFDKISCKIVESVISNININDVDSNIYISILGVDAAFSVCDVYKDLNLLIYKMRNDMVSYK